MANWLTLPAERIFTILVEISKAHPDLGTTITETVKGAATMGGGTAAGAVVGGLLGGPVGMMAGGAVGYLCGAGVAAKNVKSFKPLQEILPNMTKEEKKKIVEIARKIAIQEGINLGQNYGVELAKSFLVMVYEEHTGGKIN